jgi:uncharacterized protein YpuA (DUF1002 family)
MADHITFSLILISIGLLFFAVKRYMKWSISSGERLDNFSTQIASSNRMKLSVTDHFQKKTLGFDERKNKMLFIDLGNNIIKVVDLKDVGDFKLIKKLVSIQLEVNYQDQDKEPLTITFYNKFRDYKWMRNKLEQKAIYWESLMSQVLTDKIKSNHLLIN